MSVSNSPRATPWLIAEDYPRSLPAASRLVCVLRTCLDLDTADEAAFLRGTEGRDDLRPSEAPSRPYTKKANPLLRGRTRTWVLVRRKSFSPGERRKLFVI